MTPIASPEADTTSWALPGGNGGLSASFITTGDQRGTLSVNRPLDLSGTTTAFGNLRRTPVAHFQVQSGST